MKALIAGADSGFCARGVQRVARIVREQKFGVLINYS